MKKHLAHLAAALAVTLLFGAAAGPLSAAAAAPTAILDEENTAAAESRLNQSWLDMEIEYDDLNPVYQLYLSSAAPDDWVYQWYSTNPAVATVDRNGLVTAQKPGKTTIVKEYSKAYGGILGEIPYYAIINPANRALYEQYRGLAERFGNLHLLGRLAEYQYYNMDAIAARALDLAERL